ncbi:MAG TPA: 3-hydroxyacyl-CoA dehydrogenase NAD-binding domain-containing protein, partial [Gemmataceae bacterium]|nr:3-hydroxyacyl-CoA dehydrogenase NAD-binding domain-containing protein [Gemmataceae bacterium]
MAYFQSENLWVNRLAAGVADLVLDVPGGKVNTLDRAVLADLAKALDRVEEDATFGLLLLRTGKGASFCAGLAPKAIAAMSPEDIGDVSTLGRHFCDRLATSRLTTVAIISGGCLGGGLELALACDYRVAINKPTTIVGFPDLELGLIPMWGGTQRLPRLVGLERGLQMLLGGRRLLPRDAWAWGLVDEIADEGNPTPPAFLHNPQKRTTTFPPLRTWRQTLTESTRLGRWLIYRGAQRLLRRRLPDDMPAPWQALEAVRIGLQEGTEAGLARERAAAMTLAQTEACRNLVYLHLERDKYRKTSAARQESKRPRTVGIVADGGQGTALTYMAVTKGYEVVMREASEAALGYALFHMLTIFQQDVTRGTMARADLMKNLGNIHGTTAWKGFAELDLVLEAIGEEPEKKKALFQELEKETRAGALLVTTGASVTVTQLQENVTHPERVAGLHFLAPVNRSLLVEVVTSARTHPDVSRRLMDFVVALGRTPWLVKDEPGFLVERLLVPYFNEAILLVKEGMDPSRVDQAMARFGMTHGPLEYLDLVGLDAAAALVEALAPILEPRLVVDETFAFMAEKKWLGQKTKLGFYRYAVTKRKVNQRLVAHLRAASHIDAPHRMEALSKADQQARASRRLVLLMINEAARCLQERRAETPEALDLAMMLAGWAPHRGGPLHYARHVGIATIVGELEELA